MTQPAIRPWSAAWRRDHGYELYCTSAGGFDVLCNGIVIARGLPCGPPVHEAIERHARTSETHADTPRDAEGNRLSLEDHLSSALHAWCMAEALPFVSADELQIQLLQKRDADRKSYWMTDAETNAQTERRFTLRFDWLQAFIALWDRSVT
jgi:hypothetical protein